MRNSSMSYEDLKGKKVLVTGSSSGIGAETAKIFAEYGCFVGVHYFRTKAGGEKTLEEVREEIKLRTRQYAKRQVTWFKKNEEIKYVDFEEAQTLTSKFLALN